MHIEYIVRYSFLHKEMCILSTNVFMEKTAPRSVDLPSYRKILRHNKGNKVTLLWRTVHVKEKEDRKPVSHDIFPQVPFNHIASTAQEK
jgi:hypothetical protein